MINEIKRRLERKEKVYIELVDPNGLRDRGDIQEFLIQELLDSEKLQVLDVSLGARGNLVKIRVCNLTRVILISDDRLVFFGIVPESATFDDLINVALQAGKDGVLIGARVDFDDVRCLRVEYSSGEHVDQIFDYHDDYSEYVERIKSRYTETFVIESEECIKKIRLEAESIVLSNGEDIIDDVMFHRNEPYFTNGGVSAVKVGFNVLKGATVTQRKGKK